MRGAFDFFLVLGGGPLSNSGSSVGEGGGGGSFKSTSGGSFLICSVSLLPLAALLGSVFLLLDFETEEGTGVKTSRGGVNRSAGGSYGTGVV